MRRATTMDVGFAVPPGACDCHIHVNDPRFDYLPDAELKPPPATVADYRQLQARTGTQRVVVVQPSSYGTDNRCTLDAVAGLGLHAARAIVVLSGHESPQTLQRMNDQGARGVRVNLARGTSLDPAGLRSLCGAIAGLGWHLQLHARAERLVELEPVLQGLPVPVVLDHMARIEPDPGVSHPAYAAVRRLLDNGRTWVKLSGAYLDSRSGPPDYTDRGAVAHALIAAAPERMVWGSDWPHPSASAGEHPMPDGAALLAVLAQWAPAPSLRDRILVQNPMTLYGFASPQDIPEGPPRSDLSKDMP